MKKKKKKRTEHERPKFSQTKAGRIYLTVAITLFLVGITMLFWEYIDMPFIQMLKDPERLRALIDEKGFGAQLLFVLLVFLQTVLALIPGEPFEIAAGYAFGVAEGTILCIIGSGLGSIAAYLLARRYGKKLVAKLFPQEKIEKLTFLQKNPKRIYLYLIIFMIPGTPKDLLSYFAGLTDIKLLPWILICTLGRLPSVITSTYGGDNLGDEKYTFAIVIFAATLAISVIGLIVYDKIVAAHQKRRTKQNQE